jgi:hypothetical protein
MGAGEVCTGSSPPINNLDRWTPFGRTWSLPVILGGLIASFFLVGFWYPYWRIADQDILLVYDALLQNASLPREIVVHPAHLTVLILSRTFRLLHELGLLTTYSLPTLPPANDVDAFNRTWTSLVQIARLTSLVIVLAYVIAFGFLLRRLVGDWRAATLGMFAIAYSGGIAMSVRSVKPELLAAALAAIALLVLLIAARSSRMTARPFLVGASALLATLALDNKMQAVFLIATFPVLVLPFGETCSGNGYWKERRAALVLAATGTVAILAAIAVMPLVMQALSADPSVRIYTVHPVLWIIGVPEVLLAVWIGLGMLAFGLLWRTPILEGVTAGAAAVAGVALGLLPLYIARETTVVTLVITPIDSLYAYVSNPSFECVRQGPCQLSLASALGWLKEMLMQHSFVLKTTPRPAIFLEWAVIAGMVIAFRRGRHQLALQVLFLIGAVLAIDTATAARDLKQDYFQFTDPLIVIAATLLIAQVTTLQYGRWAFLFGAALIVTHAVFSQAEPVKHAFKRSGPEADCVFLDRLQRMEPFPFCRN